MVRQQLVEHRPREQRRESVPGTAAEEWLPGPVSRQELVQRYRGNERGQTRRRGIATRVHCLWARMLSGCGVGESPFAFSDRPRMYSAFSGGGPLRWWVGRG